MTVQRLFVLMVCLGGLLSRGPGRVAPEVRQAPPSQIDAPKLPLFVRRLVTNRFAPGVILVWGSVKGPSGAFVQNLMAVSRDDGATWQKIPVHFDWSPQSIDLAPLNGPTGSVRLLVAGENSGRLYRTDDWGESWTALDFPLLTECQRPFGLDVVHTQASPTDLYLVHRCLLPQDLAQCNPNSWYPCDQPVRQRLYRSRDGGSSWTEASSPYTKLLIDYAAPQRSALLISAADANRLYWFLGDDTWKGSADGGGTWPFSLVLSNDPGPGAISQDPTDPDRLYTADWLSVSVSEDRGQTFVRTLRPPCTQTRAIEGNPLQARSVFEFCDGVLSESLDGTATWSNRANLAPELFAAEWRGASRMVIDQGRPARIWFIGDDALIAFDTATDTARIVARMSALDQSLFLPCLALESP